jgi:hypothetical protein
VDDLVHRRRAVLAIEIAIPRMQDARRLAGERTLAATNAMLKMKKIVIADLEKAFDGA